MTTRVFRGTKEQVGEMVAQLPGGIIEAIVFVERDVDAGPATLSDEEFERVIREMEDITVESGNVDYSRESIYKQQEGE